MGLGLGYTVVRVRVRVGVGVRVRVRDRVRVRGKVRVRVRVRVKVRSFAKVRLVQPGDDVRRKFFVVSVFFATMLCSHPAHTHLFPQPLANAAAAGVEHTPLVSRPWYTRSTASLSS